MPHASSRERLSLAALLTLSIACLVLCVFLVLPFGPGLVWAFTFAIVAEPIHRWVSRRLPRRPALAAGMSVAIVALALLVPVAFVTWQVAKEVNSGLRFLQEQIDSGAWKSAIDRFPRAAQLYDAVAPAIDVRAQVQSLTQWFQRIVTSTVQAGVWIAIQTFFMLFALFFFFRDRQAVLRTLRSLMPLSDDETDELFDRVARMTHATIYGTVVTSLVQGSLGGLVFFLIGIPGAMGWGAVMAALSLVPTLGAFVIWIPAALVLAAQGEWGRALFLAAWGSTVVGLIDNVLYPTLVGKEMRLHTLLTFLAVVGGLFLAGGAGLVLGPAILAATIALLDILRRRTALGREAAQVRTGHTRAGHKGH